MRPCGVDVMSCWVEYWNGGAGCYSSRYTITSYPHRMVKFTKSRTQKGYKGKVNKNKVQATWRAKFRD